MNRGSLQGAVRRALQTPCSLAVFVTAHFVLVVLGACGIGTERAPIGALSRVLSLYSDAAGLNGSYRFFSPDVGDQAIATVDTSAESRRRQRTMIGTVRGEADLRFVNFMEFMAQMDHRRLLARVIAVRAFERDSGATEATVGLGFYHVPTMREYRAGVRPTIERHFSTQFLKRSRNS